MEKYNLSEVTASSWSNSFFQISITNENQKCIAVLYGETKANEENNLPYLDIDVRYNVVLNKYTQILISGSDSLINCYEFRKGDVETKVKIEKTVENYKNDKTLEIVIKEAIDKMRDFWMKCINDNLCNFKCEDIIIRNFIKKYKYKLSDYKVISVPIYADNTNDERFMNIISNKALVPKHIADLVNYVKIDFQWLAIRFCDKDNQILLSTVGEGYDDIEKPAALIL